MILSIKPMSQDEVSKVLAGVPAPVLKLMENDPRRVIAGGYVRDVLSGSKPKDLDVFCASREDSDWCATLVASSLEPLGYVKRSTFARTVVSPLIPIQFVYFREFVDAEDLVSQFDFLACSAGVYFCPVTKSWKGVYVEGFHADLKAKRLTFLRPAKDAGSLAPLKRAMHLAASGWRLPDADIAGILSHWQPILVDDGIRHSLKPGYGGSR